MFNVQTSVLVAPRFIDQWDDTFQPRYSKHLLHTEKSSYPEESIFSYQFTSQKIVVKSLQLNNSDYLFNLTMHHPDAVTFMFIL